MTTRRHGTNCLKAYANNRDTSEANKMEAKEHDLIHDDEIEDDDPGIGAGVHDVEEPTMSGIESTRKAYQDDGINFDKIFQAQKANSTRLRLSMHHLNSDESTDEESINTSVEVNSHWFTGFQEDEEETEDDILNLNQLLTASVVGTGRNQPVSTNQASLEPTVDDDTQEVMTTDAQEQVDIDEEEDDDTEQLMSLYAMLQKPTSNAPATNVSTAKVIKKEDSNKPKQQEKKKERSQPHQSPAPSPSTALTRTKCKEMGETPIDPGTETADSKKTHKISKESTKQPPNVETITRLISLTMSNEPAVSYIIVSTCLGQGAWPGGKITLTIHISGPKSVISSMSNCLIFCDSFALRGRLHKTFWLRPCHAIVVLNALWLLPTRTSRSTGKGSRFDGLN
jgi:hypothetical protein